MSTAANRFLDLHANTTSILFVSNEATNAAFYRPADLSPGDPTRLTLEGGEVVAARLRANDFVLFSPGYANVFGLDGKKQCAGDLPQAVNAHFDVCSGTRLWSVEGKHLVAAGCGRQIVVPLDRTGSPIGGGPCGNSPWANVGSDAGMTGAAEEVLGVVVREPKVFTVDRVGAQHRLVEKTWPTKLETVGNYASATVVANIADGTPRGLVVAGAYAYTSVRGSNGLWDIRRYTVGEVDKQQVLHSGIEDLVTFTVVEDRVVFVAGVGAKGSTFWLGAFGGEASGLTKLVACAPTPAQHLVATNAALFWTDRNVPAVGKPSLRAVQLDP